MTLNRVVIIDDEMVLGQLLQAAFATLSGNIEVNVVLNAEEALREIEKIEVQLVVADIKLPGISGMEFTTTLKQKNPQIKIILVSGLNDLELKNKALAAGADAFFPKPIDMRTFLDTSAELLELVTQTSSLPRERARETRSDFLVDLLISLRQELSALSVSVLDGHGKITASAGDPPEENLAQKIMPHVMNLIGSVDRLSASLQPESPENVISVRGNQYDLVVSPVDGYILLVFLKHTKSSVKLAIVFDAIASATTELHQKLHPVEQEAGTEASQAVEMMLKQTGGLHLPEKSSAGIPEAATPLTADEPDFEKLFQAITGKKVKTEEAESFWEAATNKTSFITSSEPGMLSFDEANQLGLTPREK